MMMMSKNVPVKTLEDMATIRKLKMQGMAQTTLCGMRMFSGVGLESRRSSGPGEMDIALVYRQDLQRQSEEELGQNMEHHHEPITNVLRFCGLRLVG